MSRIEEQVQQAVRLDAANLRPGGIEPTATEVATAVATRVIKREQMHLLMELRRLNLKLDSVKLDKLIDRYATGIGYRIEPNSAMPLPKADCA